jgi:hypothetical protein
MVCDIIRFLYIQTLQWGIDQVTLIYHIIGYGFTRSRDLPGLSQEVAGYTAGGDRF